MVNSKKVTVTDSYRKSPLSPLMRNSNKDLQGFTVTTVTTVTLYDFTRLKKGNRKVTVSPKSNRGNR